MTAAATSFEGKVVYVTGGARGLGRCAAQRMADAGARVASIDINQDGLEATARGRQGVHSFVLDVTDTAAIEANVREVETRLGPIDRVYSAAAILDTELLTSHPTAAILRVMEVDYRSIVNVAKAVLPGMLARGSGELIHFASIAAWVPALHFGAYAAAKSAVATFTEVLAHENRRRGLRFCCVCPPLVATPMLADARSRPKSLEHPAFPPISPDTVLDAIERDLARERLWCFPNRRSRLVWLARRFAPGLVWEFMHRLERS
jgi:NAD(P)-dependent dehydrogenase (short-subunit alcohol dehydrogenase family)